MSAVIHQPSLMKFAPHTGEAEPYPSQADQWRAYHGRVAWLFNPWTGDARCAYDIGSDTFGHLIADPDAALVVANTAVKAARDSQKIYPGDPGWTG